MFICFNFFCPVVLLLCTISGGCGGTCSILLAGGIAWRLVPAIFVYLPFIRAIGSLGRAQSGCYSYFLFFWLLLPGAELLCGSRGLLIGPTSASRARGAGNDGRSFRFNKINWLKRRNAVKLAHHGGALVSFLVHFLFF